LLGLNGICLGDFSIYAASSPAGVDDVTFGHEGVIHPKQWDSYGVCSIPGLLIDNIYIILGGDYDTTPTGAEPSNDEAERAAQEQKAKNLRR